MFEELLLRDAPPGYEAPSEVETAAAQMLKKMSDSTRRSIDYTSAPEREVIQEVTGVVGAADGVDEAQVGKVVDAASAGFDPDVLSNDTLLDSLPPHAGTLAFKSADGHVLKGREIVYKFKEGWFRGRASSSRQPTAPSRPTSASATTSSSSRTTTRCSTNPSTHNPTLGGLRHPSTRGC